MRRFIHFSLLSAWLCASGAMLDMAQVVAWTRMFAGYARTESLAAAARETFDPGKPCALCRAVGQARDAAGAKAPATSAAAEKIILIAETPVAWVAPGAGARVARPERAARRKADERRAGAAPARGGGPPPGLTVAALWAAGRRAGTSPAGACARLPSAFPPFSLRP